MSHDPLRIIQISDTHLFDDTEKTLLGIKTQESFQAVIDHLKKSAGEIDFIIHSGDLSQDGSDSAYLRLGDMFKEFEVPVYYVPGNHDNAKQMQHSYPYETIFNDKHIILKTWHIILLNSQIPEKVPGYLDESQLRHLKHCLTSYPEHHAMIVFHHQPLPVGSQWLDKLGLTNADEFWQTIANHPTVKGIFFGHVHQEHEAIKNGIKCYSVPSTCIQFKRQQDAFGLEKLPPGYRLIHLYEDGHIETKIERLSEYIGVFDVDAKGY